ncbi:MAG: rod shape-determining protein MreC [Ignavibacteriaceae bacterium]|nr:rod shape-determining protein MreC [Ignavibacteriaceae bacterium]
MFRFLSNIWNNYKEYFILVFLLILGLILLSSNQKSGIKKVRAIAFGTFASATSLITDVFSVAELKSDNTRLREKNAELMLQMNKLREFGIENEELKGLLKLKDTVKYPLIPAKIVSKSFSTSQNTITILGGNSDGIKPGMPVINDQGLLGIIYSTSDDFSIARTLRNRDLKLTVKDERSRIDGIMKWNGEDLVMVDVPKTFDIKPGDRILTSELSSLISVPIPIGMVMELSKMDIGIFNEVRVKPFVNFSKAENVYVIGIVESKQKNQLELNFFNRK